MVCLVFKAFIRNSACFCLFKQKRTSKLEVDPPRGVEKKKGTSIGSFRVFRKFKSKSRENEFGDKNNLETGPKWAKFGPNYF